MDSGAATIYPGIIWEGGGAGLAIFLDFLPVGLRTISIHSFEEDFYTSLTIRCVNIFFSYTASGFGIGLSISRSPIPRNKKKSYVGLLTLYNYRFYKCLVGSNPGIVSNCAALE